MRVIYRNFSVDSIPMFSVGRFFAQARIYRIEAHTHDEIEIYAAINLPDFGTEADAIAFSNEWAVHQIEENAFEVAGTQTEHA
jgi:hypothetical protein